MWKPLIDRNMSVNHAPNQSTLFEIFQVNLLSTDLRTCREDFMRCIDKNIFFFRLFLQQTILLISSKTILSDINRKDKKHPKPKILSTWQNNFKVFFFIVSCLKKAPVILS